MYSFLSTKKFFSTAVLIVSFSIAAQTQEPNEPIDEATSTTAEMHSPDVSIPIISDAEVESSEAKSPVAESSSTVSTNMNTQTCPEQFYQIKLPNNGKLCQVFAAELPASMIFFVPQVPEEVIAFYRLDTSTFSSTRKVKDRVLLQSEDKNTTLIISKDGKGTQVDVLVKSSNS